MVGTSSPPFLWAKRKNGHTAIGSPSRKAKQCNNKAYPRHRYPLKTPKNGIPAYPDIETRSRHSRTFNENREILRKNDVLPKFRKSVVAMTRARTRVYVNDIYMVNRKNILGNEKTYFRLREKADKEYFRKR
jgi:hypothetical protein